jgi:hypothetical protein
MQHKHSIDAITSGEDMEMLPPTKTKKWRTSSVISEESEDVVVGYWASRSSSSSESTSSTHTDGFSAPPLAPTRWRRRFGSDAVSADRQSCVRDTRNNASTAALMDRVVAPSASLKRGDGIILFVCVPWRERMM